MTRALRHHWPEYLMEAAGLGLFMLSACLFAALLEHPGSPVRAAIDDADLRRVLMGLAMGLTAAAIFYSPWGKQSGAHLNPAVTLAFLRLGKIAPWDAFFYCVAQLGGGLAGVLLSAALLQDAIGHPSVAYVVTIPGRHGAGAAFAAEMAMSFGIILTVLVTASQARWSRFAPLCAAALVGIYIAVEAPLSGMSINPARTFASALPADTWTGLWIYLAAPTLGMLLAAELFGLAKRRVARHCAKLHHHNRRRCIFCGGAA